MSPRFAGLIITGNKKGDSEMEKILAARHFNLHDDARQAINGRLIELETEYRNLTSARVVLDKQKHRFMAEVIIHGGHIDIEGTASAKDPVYAFDMAFEKAERQLKRKRDKVQDHKCAPLSQLECELSDLEMETAESEEVAS